MKTETEWLLFGLLALILSRVSEGIFAILWGQAALFLFILGFYYTWRARRQDRDRQ